MNLGSWARTKIIWFGTIGFWLIAAIAVYLVAKPRPQTFADNPVSHESIAKLCKSNDFTALNAQYLKLSDEEKTKFLTVLYQYACLEPSGIDASPFYERMGTNLIHNSAEFLPPLAQYALTQLQSEQAQDVHANIEYLTKYYTKLSAEQQTLLFDALKTAPQTLMIESFSRINTPQMLEYLETIELTPSNRTTFLKYWPIFSQTRQADLLSDIVNATWFMQPSGSTQLGQYLGLLVQRFDAPEMQPFILRIFVESISIDGKKIKHQGKPLAEAFSLPPLLEPDAAYLLKDLTPWLSVSAWYRIQAKAELVLFRADAPVQCYAQEAPKPTINNVVPEIMDETANEEEQVQQEETDDEEDLPTKPTLDELCAKAVIHRHPVVRDFSYRVFLGVETGSPRRLKNEAENKTAAGKLTLALCNNETCVTVWDGKANKEKQTLNVDYSKELFLLTTSTQNPMPTPFAARLLGRTPTMPNGVWEEIASAFAYSPMQSALPVRTRVDVRELCPATGPCTLNLQLRPSLRMARMDPRIKDYQGATIDLSPVVLQIQTAANSRVWSEFLARWESEAL